MTPKEKAEELVGKFKIPLILSDTDAGEEIICTTISKECALIAVDEVINSELFKWLEDEIYWQEVKEEVEKL